VDQFSDRLGRISELSEDELKTLREELLSEFNSVDDGEYNADKVALMKELSTAFQATKAEEKNRVEQASQLAADAAEAAAIMKGDSAEEEDEESSEADEEVIDTDTAVDEEDEEAKELSSEEPAAEVDETPEAAEETVEEETAEEAEEAEADEEEAEKVEEPTPAETEAATKEDEEDEEDEDKDAVKKASEASTTEASIEESVSETPADSVAELATEEIITESSEEPVTASNTPKDLEAPEDRRPQVSEAPSVAITASAEMSGVSVGSTLPNLRSVAQLLINRKNAMGNTTGGDNEKASVAKFSTAFPESRTLDPMDVHANRDKVEAVVASAMKAYATEGIVAAGGLVAPITNRYELFGFSETTARPVKDSLLVFAADRGGIRYITPPTLKDGIGATSLWTLEDDVAAATPGEPNPVKPSLRFVAGEEVTAYTDAIPLIMTFGNIISRTYPELVERQIELAKVWHARYSEVRLLTRIGSLSTSVSADSQLGAARDIFVQVEQGAAAYRSRHRLDPTAPLRVIFPEWFKNALRSDLTKQLPGDGQDVTFNLADADINRWFASRNITVTWHLDGEEGQIFGDQTPGAALEAFPENVIWYLFAEGTFLFLDGGELDLGLVRDSTLNGTNDYKMFMETFEGVAKIGIESLRITSKLAIIGASSGTVDLTA
jgi:hypothetical protein